MPSWSKPIFAARFAGGEKRMPVRISEVVSRIGDPGVEPQSRLRRVGRAGEEIDHLARGLRVGIGEAEGLAVEAGLVGDVVDRVGDVVDRNDVDLAAFDTEGRQPGRQHPPGLLQQLEPVVGPVDLVDYAGARVTDDDPRAVDPPWPRALLAHDPLGLVLGAEVGMSVEVFGLVEHVLAPLAPVEAGDRDRADLVEATRLDCPGEFDCVTRTLDVGDLLGLGAGGHVVDRGEVEEVIDLTAQGQQVLLGDPEAGLGKVAGDRHHPGPVGAEGRAQLLEAPARSRPHQGVDRALALEQSLHEVAADESGGPGDEVVHRLSLPPLFGSAVP
jgi:hypothetical protein